MNEQDTYIYNMMKAEGVSIQAIEFFLKLLNMFEVMDPIKSSSKKLAKAIGKSERTIQRYIEELSKKYTYIVKEPIYDNTNPKKPFIKSNIYHKSMITKMLIVNAENYCKRDVNVGFIRQTSNA